MARIRSIHPSACESRSLAQLSHGAERTLWRLIVHTDDEGRGRADPELLASRLYPRQRSSIGADDVDTHLRELEATDTIRRYSVDGEPYFWIPSWSQWQKPQRPQKSNLPAPDQADSFSESSMSTHEPSVKAHESSMKAHRQLMPGEGGEWSGEGDGDGEGGGVGDREGRTTDDADASSTEPQKSKQEKLLLQFEQFWGNYPRHHASGKPGGGGSKSKARQRFNKLTAAERETCLTAVGNYRDWCERSDGEYPAHATTWLSERRWEQWQTPAAPPEDSRSNEVSDVSELYRRKPFQPDSSGTDRGVM